MTKTQVVSSSTVGTDHLETNSPSTSQAVAQDATLQSFGYRPELKRTFNFIGMVGFSFNIVTCWSSLGGVLVIGIESGGPPVMVWSWLGVSLLSLCVAYSLAEMCSAYPVAGGQYSWVAIMAPPRFARALSWITGWFMNTGIVAMGATTNFVAANFVLGVANLNHPSYVIQRWHTVLLTWLIAIVAAFINTFFSHTLSHISTAMLIFNVLSFITVVVTILVMNDHKQPASFVFMDFQNATGFDSAGMAVMVGLLQSFFGMCCYDAPSKMVEESNSPSTEAPQAIIYSVFLGGGTGFIFLIAAFFCIGDLDATANTPTGVPLIEIFRYSTKSNAGASGLAALIAIILLVAANALTAEGSRGLWAFSRDRGLPFSYVFAKVDQKTQVPVNAIFLCALLQMGLTSIYFASYEGFSTVVAFATMGFYASYAMPLFVRLVSYYTGHVRRIPGAYSLGRYGPVVNAIGLVFLLFACIDFNWPQVGPVNAQNMNYCSAAFGVIVLVSLITWISDGHKNFRGPQVEFVSAVEAEEKGREVVVTDFGVSVDKASQR